MQCKYFGSCGSCTLYEHGYEWQLEQKVEFVKNLLSEFNVPEPEVFASQPQRFRSRVEFRVYREADGWVNYAMRRGGEKKGTVAIAECSIVDEKIAYAMRHMLVELNSEPLLKERLYEVHFLSGDDGVVVTLVYHKALGQEWHDAASRLISAQICGIIGRSRGCKTTVGYDFVVRAAKVGEQKLLYKLPENSFTQPNSLVNEKMLNWAVECADAAGEGDLLEAYCGSGNFTMALAGKFRKLFATELSKAMVDAAKENAALNGIENAYFGRLSSFEMSQAIRGDRLFNRLAHLDLKQFDFCAAFVDPPRSGLDESSLRLVGGMEQIIYISCSPHSLQRDLTELCKTHKVGRFALFDQFAYTSHIECGVMLQRKA